MTGRPRRLASALISNSYKHKKYGKIYTPEFEYVEWRLLDDASDVDELPATVAAIELIRLALARPAAVARAVDQIQVEVPIPVVIDPGGAGSHPLGQPALLPERLAADVGVGDPGRGRTVDEGRAGRRLRLGRHRRRGERRRQSGQRQRDDRRRRTAAPRSEATSRHGGSRLFGYWPVAT